MEVTQDFYSSNEELLAKLQAGGTGYDVIVPSDYMVSVMRKSDIIEELDRSKIPNFDNVGADFKGLPFDPENKYSMPYQWGTTGILYNKKEIGRDRAAGTPCGTPQYEGKIAMMGDVRETMGAALVQLGYSMNSHRPGAVGGGQAVAPGAEAPLARILRLAPRASRLVQNGDILLGHVYSGDGFSGHRREQGPRLRHPRTERPPAGRTTWPYRSARSTRTTPTSS